MSRRPPTKKRAPASRRARAPAWAVLLDWLVERGSVGVSVLEILTTTRGGRRLGASYRQRVTQLREMLGDGSVTAESMIVDGETQTVYVFSFFFEEAAGKFLEPHRTALCAERG